MRRLQRSRRLKTAAGMAFCVLAVTVGFLAARRLTSSSWPLQEANVVLVLGASAAYLASFVFRALGWQRLFPGERPDRSRCLAACGAAAASGVVLPFRLDYVVKVSTLRRLGGVRLGFETVGLSIVSLGLVDAVAMLPLAVAAIATSGAIFRAPLIVVLLFCLGCIAVLALGPRLVQFPLVRRSRRLERIFNRVGDHASISRSTFAASGFLFCCWTTRALGSALLLSSLGVVVVADPGARHPLHGRGGVDSADHRGRRHRQRRRHVRRPPRARRHPGRGDQLLAGVRHAPDRSALAATVIGVGGSLFFTARRRYLGHATLA